MVKREKRIRRARRRKRSLLHVAPRKKPVIGITCEVNKLRPFYSEFELCCDYRYLRAVMRSGGIPILLPLNPIRRDINRLIDHIDGLVIIGGADIPPSFYGEKSSKRVAPMYRGRTYFDMNLYRLAQKKRIPVLAICYGMQLLNVIYGGTIYQDITTHIKGARNHRSKRSPLHHIQVVPGSLCHKVFGKTTFLAHSEHHQAVKVPGRSLKVTAFAEDGVAEALEGPPLTLAIQWHPERQGKDQTQMRLFRYFMRLVRSERARRLRG